MKKIRIEFNQKYQKKSEIKSLAHAVFCLPAVYKAGFSAQVAFNSLSKDFKMQPKIITVNDVCQLIGKSRTTVWRWQGNGNMPPSFKLGPNSVGFYEADIIAWLESRRKRK